MFVATTEFSLGHSLLSVEDIVTITKENDLDHVIVTDTMSVSSMIPLAEKLGGKLITGVRLTLVDEALQERLPVYQPKVYPCNERGMQLIYKYLTRSFERPYFYEQPRLDMTSFYQMLEEANGDIFVSTGDFNNIFTHPRFEKIIDYVTRVLECVVIVDLCPVPTARWDRINHTALKTAESYNLAINQFIPSLYKKEDAELFPVHYSINKNVEFNFLNPYFDGFHYVKDITDYISTMFDRLNVRYGVRFSKPAVVDLNSFSYYQWHKQDALLPKLSKTPMETLKKLTIEGFKKRCFTEIYGFKPSEEQAKTEYVARIKYELATIDKLGFSDYFLLVHELTNWCQKQEIKVGPGRGSVGGSLIAFCLGITDVDPIRFGLMFERFINPTRIDLPDIDLDFMSTRRNEIIDHLLDRYGAENVAGIVNYASLQSKSALRSTCRILGLPEEEYACSKLVPSNFGFSVPLEEAKTQVIEIKQFADKYPDYWAKATKLEKKLRNFSTHAAGIIVSSRPLTLDAVVETRSGTRAINWDKKICEKQGLIKLDILGLTTLDIIDLSLNFIKERHGINVNLHEISLDDYHVLDAFAKGDTGGIFQFEGGSVRKLLSGLAKGGPLTFDDLVAANALNRPGPIEAGLVDAYIDGKNGNLHEVDHVSMTEILEPTYNVMVYQEQIMKVASEFAGYTLPEADNLRKIMGKKLPEEMKKEGNKFVDGAVKTHGIPSSIAERIFDQISKFAFYAFNKSHSVEYSLLSYICMWLKVNYPIEFYAASLTHVNDKKVRAIISEAGKYGIKVLPPDINFSTDKFNPVGNDTIVAPLNKVKYVSAAASHIMAVRADGKFSTIEEFQSRVTKRIVNSRAIACLKAIGAFDSIDPACAAMDAQERSIALNEFLPSIPLGHVIIGRSIELDTASKNKLGTILLKLKDEDDRIVMPTIGKAPKFMVVFDSATATEAKNGRFTETKAFNTIARSLYKADLNKYEGYWTGLVKRAKDKKEKIFDNRTLEHSFNILKQEIEIIRPPVIVCLGSQVNRMFIPSLKGGVMDNAKQVIYNKELDANIVIGFNPSQIFFNEHYGDILDEIFEIVASMV